ncbi:MAG: hypothetical protein KME43_23940 [Myxacorys chilensis ATA2-1-KO14]|jgi:hypothetical protein|nr:hypothetical protein [Myxacorys chilensis ATA2-1-KO14]
MSLEKLMPFNLLTKEEFNCPGLAYEDELEDACSSLFYKQGESLQK